MGQILRISSERLGDIKDVIRFLIAIENVYNNVYAFDLILDDAKKRYEEIPLSLIISGRTTKRRGIRVIRRPENIVLPEDRLKIHSIVIKSPGFWEFTGAPDILETIRKYISDRYERKKDKTYRNRLEQERMELENEKLKRR